MLCKRCEGQTVENHVLQSREYGWCMWELVLHRVEMGEAMHGEKESMLFRVRQKCGGGG